MKRHKNRTNQKEGRKENKKKLINLELKYTLKKDIPPKK